MATWLDMIRLNGEPGEPTQFQVLRPLSGAAGSGAGGVGISGDFWEYLEDMFSEETISDVKPIVEKLIETYQNLYPQERGLRAIPLGSLLPVLWEAAPLAIPVIIGGGISAWAINEIIEMLDNVKKALEPDQLDQIITILTDMLAVLEQGLLYSENDDSKAILKTGLMFQDADAMQKGVLQRGLLRTLTEPEPPDPAGKIKSLLQDLEAKLEALEFNDHEIDLGPIRIWLRSQIIEY